MVYVTVKQSPMFRQMTIEELLFGTSGDALLNANTSNTRTERYKELPIRISGLVDTDKLISKLEAFNAETGSLRAGNRSKQYRTFHIPKSSGHGLRRIDAPNDELMAALRKLKAIFEKDFGAMYHTSAFAYIKKRCTLDAIKRHQSNESKWFAKFDLKNFFGNTTPEFAMRQISMIFPFSEVVRTPRGKAALETALDLAFLNGGLPQGTPISPLITNIMMIPVDFALSNGFRDFDSNYLVYTRYADDFIISSKYKFDVRKVEKHIMDALASFGTPFNLNPEKTRFGSSAGHNFNLGVMLNKDNEITIGSKKKRRFQAMLSNYVLDRRNGTPWDLEDIQILEGYRNYYRMVEGEVIDRIVAHTGEKYGVDIVQCIKEDLKT